MKGPEFPETRQICPQLFEKPSSFCCRNAGNKAKDKTFFPLIAAQLGHIFVYKTNTTSFAVQPQVDSFPKEIAEYLPLGTKFCRSEKQLLRLK